MRRALPEAVIESRPAGYLLRLYPRDTDIVRFEELAAAGRASCVPLPAVIAPLDELRLIATEHRAEKRQHGMVVATCTLFRVGCHNHAL